jgi:predicted porin
MQETTATTLQPAGLFGAQYSLHRRFAVYGEVGAAYSRLTTKGESTTSLGFSVPVEQTGHGFANVGGVGVIVYF